MRGIGNGYALFLTLFPAIMLAGFVVPLNAQILAANQSPTTSDSSAGYLVDSSNVANNAVNDVSSYWRVPTVAASQNTSILTESVGVGLGTQIQIGTAQVSSNGTILYRAYFIRNPEDASIPVLIPELNGKVGPETLVSAEIHWNTGENWTLSMTAESSASPPSKFFTTSVSHIDDRSSAEWYVQRVSAVPIPVFDSVSFLHAAATINGSTQRIGEMPHDRLNLFDFETGCPLIETSDLGVLGDSFNATYVPSTLSCAVTLLPPVDFGIPLIVGGLLVATPLVTILLSLSVGIVEVHRPGRSGLSPASINSSVQRGKMISCKKCGIILDSSARFCDQCGTPHRV